VGGAQALLDELGEPGEQYQVGDVVQFPTPDGQGSYAGCGATGEQTRRADRPFCSISTTRWRASQ
jgi:hypothetical protein